jgi:hypothetical protein
VEVPVMSVVFALLVVLMTALPGAAQDRLDAMAASVDRAITPAAESAAVERMARFLGTTAEALRAERASTRLGWGDLFVAHRLATRGGHPLEKVFAARRTGATWEEIAGEARVEPDALAQDVAAVWPDAGRPATAPAPATDEKKSVADRVKELFRQGRDDPPTDRTQQNIRDRMIRGGGRTW